MYNNDMLERRPTGRPQRYLKEKGIFDEGFDAFFSKRPAMKKPTPAPAHVRKDEQGGSRSAALLGGGSRR
jgi:hypothetical protein